MSHKERKAKAEKRRAKYRSMILEAMQNALAEGKNAFDAGDNCINNLVKENIQDKAVILDVAYQVRDALEILLKAKMEAKK